LGRKTLPKKDLRERGLEEIKEMATTTSENRLEYLGLLPKVLLHVRPGLPPDEIVIYSFGSMFIQLKNIICARALIPIIQFGNPASCVRKFSTAAAAIWCCCPLETVISFLLPLCPAAAAAVAVVAATVVATAAVAVVAATVLATAAAAATASLCNSTLDGLYLQKRKEGKNPRSNCASAACMVRPRCFRISQLKKLMPHRKTRCRRKLALAV
jgi:hypothetical protein